jgi:hypothetical protein
MVTVSLYVPGDREEGALNSKLKVPMVPLVVASIAVSPLVVKLFEK